MVTLALLHLLIPVNWIWWFFCVQGYLFTRIARVNNFKVGSRVINPEICCLRYTSYSLPFGDYAKVHTNLCQFNAKQKVTECQADLIYASIWNPSGHFLTYCLLLLQEFWIMLMTKVSLELVMHADISAMTLRTNWQKSFLLIFSLLEKSMLMIRFSS